MGLIDLAIQKTKEWREHIKTHDFGLDKPLTRNAYYSSFYLGLREDIIRGCREAVKTIPDKTKRTVAFSILMCALNTIFRYGKKPEIVEYYNSWLQEYVGMS